MPSELKTECLDALNTYVDSLKPAVKVEALQELGDLIDEMLSEAEDQGDTDDD